MIQRPSFVRTLFAPPLFKNKYLNRAHSLYWSVRGTVCRTKERVFTNPFDLSLTYLRYYPPVVIANLSQETARQALLEYAEMMSREFYSAGWLIDLEHYLWMLVVQGEPDQEPSIPQRALDTLRRLSTQAGGWFIYGDGTCPFIMADQWIGIHRDWVEKNSKRVKS